MSYTAPCALLALSIPSIGPSHPSQRPSSNVSCCPSLRPLTTSLPASSGSSHSFYLVVCAEIRRSFICHSKSPARLINFVDATHRPCLSFASQSQLPCRRFGHYST